MLLAQGMPLPRAGHQNSLQVWMIVKPDSKHVPDFALIPIGGGPDVGDGWEGWVLTLKRDFQTKVLVAFVREQMIDDREVTVRLAVARGSLPLVNCGQIVKCAVRFRDLSLKIAQQVV